jgi:hypothetical protein
VFYKPGKDGDAPKDGPSRTREERVRELRANVAKLGKPADGETKSDPAKADAKAAEPPKAPDAAKEPPKEPEKQTDAQKAQFAAIARAEKRIREQARELEEREAKLRTTSEADAAKLAQAREIQAILDSGDKYAVLDKLGFDVNEWARRVIAKREGKTAPDPQASEALAETQKLRQELAERDAKAAAAESEARVEAARNQAVADVTKIVQAAGDKYALIGARNAASEVVRLMELRYQQTGRMPEYDATCDEVEAFLEADAASYLGVEKVRKKIPGASTDPAPSPDGSRSDPRSPKTTTRAQPNKTTVPDRVSPGAMSRAERSRAFREQLRALKR